MTDLATLWAELPAITTLRASGDGRWAFWTCGGLSETDELWGAPTDGSAPAARLTFTEDHLSLRDVSPDGGRVILAQSVHANEHDHLLLFERASGALTRLTPVQDSHYLYGGVFTAAGDAVLFLADYDYDSGTVTAGGWLWRQDLISGARICLARSDSPFETGPKLSPGGARILWHRHEAKPGATQLWVLNADGSALREVLRISETANSRGEWLDDDRIAVVTDHDGRDRLGVLTLSTGALDWLAGEPTLCPHAVLAGSDGHFACIAHRQSHTEAVIFPGGTRLPNHSGRRSLLPHDALPGGGWLAEAFDGDAAHEVVAVAADGTCTRLFTPPETARAHIAPQDFRWTAADGTPLQGWLYLPEGPPRGFVAYVHGGPTWHSEDWVNPKIGFWVQSGYAVLDPNYRGSTGFGAAFREAVKDDGWGGREQTDIRAGIEAAIAAGHARRGRIGMAGNSYGGFSSWTGITRHADLVDAAIPMCGMYRLDIDYHETEMPHGRAYSEEMMGGTPEEFPEKYANASPGNFIHQIKGRLMVVHGLADSNVGPENTHTAVRELTAAGIPHEVLLFENEGHGVFRRSNVATYLRRSAAFFEAAFANR
ncbi:MAG: S9 family peptidase [Rhodobacteraceae bacterium]|nr:S9 family peptidase [Paracoccaceae bacterium]